MAKSRSCYERLRSFLKRHRYSDSDGEQTRTCSSDTGDECRRPVHESTVHYFNHASQAPLSAEVQKLGIELVRSPPWKARDDSHSAPYNQARVRSLFASLVESDENEDVKETGSRIAIFPSTAFAITFAARNIAETKTKQRSTDIGRILILQDQFDSAVYPWQQVCDESGGKLTLDIVGHPGEEIQHDYGDGASGWTLAVLNRLKEHSGEIRAACLPPLHWSDGTLLDLEAIGKVCRQYNIPLIVDATQGACNSPWSKKAINCVSSFCTLDVFISFDLRLFVLTNFHYFISVQTRSVNSCWYHAVQRTEDPTSNDGL